MHLLRSLTLTFIIFLFLGCAGAIPPPPLQHPLEHWTDPATHVLSYPLSMVNWVNINGSLPNFLGDLNPEYVMPTFRINRGDTLRIELENDGETTANLHFHGMEVSPVAPGDDVWIEVPPIGNFTYELKIPLHHPQGLFWYHSHSMYMKGHTYPKGGSEAQVMQGLSGLIVVEGLLDPFPTLKDIKEVLFCLKDIKLYNVGGQWVVPDGPEIATGGPTYRNINGYIFSSLSIAPGEVQLWRFANTSPNLYWNLYMNGTVFYEVAHDGFINNRLLEYTELRLAPATRSEVLVIGPPAGEYLLETLPVSTGVDSYPRVSLVAVTSEGTPVSPIDLPTPDQFPVLKDFRGTTFSKSRTFTFSRNETLGNVYLMNHKEFDHDRIDAVIPLGSIEEWTILNEDNGEHAFHIHQIHYQVLEVDYEPVDFYGYHDTTTITQRSPEGVPGQLKLALPFTDPNIVGKFMFHCHIMNHEDRGMMMVAQVVSNSTGATKTTTATTTSSDTTSNNPASTTTTNPTTGPTTHQGGDTTRQGTSTASSSPSPFDILSLILLSAFALL